MSVAIKDNNSEIAAKRWAKALMELSLENEGISKETILANLKEIAETINSSDELSSVINNPSVSVEEKQIVLCKLFQNQILPIVYNFLYVLNLRKRVNIISEIAKEFSKELDEYNNTTHVEITSAINLDDGKKQVIKDRVSEKLHKNVIVNWDTNPDIIAGLVFKIDETVVDNSVQHRLEDLSKNIISNQT